MVGDEIDYRCTRFGELDVVKALPEPRDAIFTIVEDEHWPRPWDIESHSKAQTIVVG
jgi:hypothetical protein